MPGDESKAIVKRYFEELLNTGTLRVADEILAPEFIFRGPRDTVRGIEGFKQFIQALRGAFPDQKFTVEDEVAEADKVMTWFTMSGTHRGPLMGAPPTGKGFSVAGADFFRLRGGRIVEIRAVFNTLAQAQQLSFVPTGEQGEK